MISQWLTAPVRCLRPALFPLALTAAIWAAWNVHPPLAGASPRSIPLSSAWRPGWLPSDPPATGADARSASGPAFDAPVWTLVRIQSPGLFVALDPVTGLPTRPSAAQRRAAAERLLSEDALLAPLSPLVIERLPGGGEMVHLGGRFQAYSVARRDAQGRIVTDCSLDPTAARKLLTQPVPATRRPPSQAAPAAAHREER